MPDFVVTFKLTAPVEFATAVDCAAVVNERPRRAPSPRRAFILTTVKSAASKIETPKAIDEVLVKTSQLI